MASPLDTALRFVSCRVLLWVLGALTLAAALKTGLQAGHGGNWGWWTLLALLLAAFWIYTWFYCGREAVTGQRELAGQKHSGSAKAIAAASGAAVRPGGTAGRGSARKTQHWARSSRASDGAGVTSRDATSSGSIDREVSGAQGDEVAEAGSVADDSLASGASGQVGLVGGGGTAASVVDSGKIEQEVTGSPGRADDDADGGTVTHAAAGDEAEPSGEKTAGEAASSKPATLGEARDGKADDLKQISGVGPKLEALLHSLGYFHFDQIAGWTEENVAWVDEHLGFKGRITRDDWIGQAKKLAAGETTKFAERVARGEVESSKKA